MWFLAETVLEKRLQWDCLKRGFNGTAFFSFTCPLLFFLLGVATFFLFLPVPPIWYHWRAWQMILHIIIECDQYPWPTWHRVNHVLQMPPTVISTCDFHFIVANLMVQW